jgi:hypothetical protein
VTGKIGTDDNVDGWVDKMAALAECEVLQASLQPVKMLLVKVNTMVRIIWDAYHVYKVWKLAFKTINLVLRKLWLGPSLESELSRARARAGLVISMALCIHNFGNRVGQAGLELASICFLTWIFVILKLWIY